MVMNLALKNRAVRLAETRCVSMASVICTAVSEYLAREEDKIYPEVDKPAMLPNSDKS